MFTNYNIYQPFSSNFSMEKRDKIPSTVKKHGAGRSVNYVVVVVVVVFF